MKAGWQTKPVGELLMPQTTINPSSAPDKTFSYIDVSSVSTKTFAIQETQTLLGKDAPSRARKLVRTNDVIFATIRPTLKRVALIPEEFDGQVCSTGYVVLRPTSALNPGYLFYWLFTKDFSGQMVALQRGASYPAVSDGDVRRQLISFPSRTEQERIVAILDRALKGIARAEANTGKNLRRARDLFLNDIEDRFSQIWRTSRIVKLSELATDITDGDHLPPPKSSHGVPFVTISNINKQSHVVDFSDTFFVSRKYYDNLKSNKKPRKRDLLYTVTGSYGIPVKVEDDFDFCFQRHIGLIRPKQDVSTSWLYYLMLSPQLIRQADERATGAAQKTVSLSVLRNVSVPKLSMSQQQKMTTQLDELKVKTERLEAAYRSQLSMLGELKESLLNQAFSGNL